MRYNSKQLTQFAQNYLTYLEQVGVTNPEDIIALKHPYNPDVYANTNGKTIATNADAIIFRLIDVRKPYDNWKIQNMEFYPSIETGTITIRYELITEPLEKYTAIKIFKFDNTGKIMNIVGVYAKQ